MAASSEREFVLIRFKRGGKKFEMGTFAGKVQQWRDKKVTAIDDVVQQRTIYTNIATGVQAGAADLAAAFEGLVMEDIIKLILEKGEFQLTAAERKEKLEKKRREVVNHLHKYYINPKTGLPHPVVRIEAALDEMKVRIDPDSPADKQVLIIVKDMPAILPIRKQEIRGMLTIPNKHTGAVHGIIAQYVKIETERWTDVGCLMTIVSNPGDWATLMGILNDITKGDFNLEVENAAASSDEPDEAGGGRGGRGGRGKRGGGGARGRGAPKRK